MLNTQHSTWLNELCSEPSCVAYKEELSHHRAIHPSSAWRGPFQCSLKPCTPAREGHPQSPAMGPYLLLQATPHLWLYSEIWWGGHPPACPTKPGHRQQWPQYMVFATLCSGFQGSLLPYWCCGPGSMTKRIGYSGQGGIAVTDKLMKITFWDQVAFVLGTCLPWIYVWGFSIMSCVVSEYLPWALCVCVCACVSVWCDVCV